MDLTPRTDLDFQSKMSRYITDHFNKEQAQPTAKPFNKPHSLESLNTKWHTIHLIKTAISSDLILIPSPSRPSALSDSYVEALLTNQQVTTRLYVESFINHTATSPQQALWKGVIQIIELSCKHVRCCQVQSHGITRM